MKYTYKDFATQYATDDACLDAIMERNSPGKRMTCPGCGVIATLFHRITGRRAYACQECGHHYYPCAGTIFEHSSTPLTLWFHAMYLMTATRNGVSGKELQRQLGVTYKCAWRIGHQLRILMGARDKANTPPQLSGHVEVDETYIGGRVRGKGIQRPRKPRPWLWAWSSVADTSRLALSRMLRNAVLSRYCKRTSRPAVWLILEKVAATRLVL